MNIRRDVFPALISLSLIACGESGKMGDDDDTMPDASNGEFTPAEHAPQPQLVNQGGTVLAAPKVRAVFFANDTETKGKIEQFLGELATSTYWTTNVSEYGVGALTVMPTINLTETPPASDDALTTWLASRFDGTHPEWGTYDPNTIYSVFLPPGAVLTSPFGNSCEAYGAFHDEATGTGGQSIVFALMPRCDASPGGSTLDELTISFSHELAEAATDPRVETAPAFGGVDDDHAIWGFTPGAENGDFCEYLPNAYQKLVGDFQVQRNWSNAAAAAGHDPCVPAMPGPFAAAAPQLDETVGMTDGPNGAQMTKGVKIPMGMSKTIDVKLFSDSATDAFTVEAIDVAGEGGSPKELKFAWDKTTGKNGDVLKLTITRLRAGDFGGSEFAINTTLGADVTQMWWSYAAN